MNINPAWQYSLEEAAPAKRPGLRRIFLAAGLIVLIAGAYVLWFPAGPAAAPDMLTATVTRGDVEETVLATGTLKPSRLVAVGAQVSGRITALKVSLGDTVTEGDLIAEIDSVTQQNTLRTSEAALAYHKAQKQEKQATLTLNRQSLERQKELVSKGAVSQAEYDSALADLNVTQAQIDALDAQIIQGEVAVETARVNLGYTKITAPSDGTVLAVVNQEGQTVNAVQSAPTIVILGQLETMTVRTEISEADIVKVRPGQPLWFTILGEPSERHEATLQSIEPAPDAITSDSSVTANSSSGSSSSASSSDEAIYFNGIFNVPNPEGHFRTYMTAEVHIVLGRAEDVLTLPSSALSKQSENGSYTVSVLEPDGAITERKVVIGLNDKVTAEILEGLNEGEKVVTGTAAAGPSMSNMPRPPMGL